MTRTIALLSATAFAILLPIENASALRKCNSSEMQECFDWSVKKCAYRNGGEDTVEEMFGGTRQRRACEADANDDCRWHQHHCEAP